MSKMLRMLLGFLLSVAMSVSVGYAAENAGQQKPASETPFADKVDTTDAVVTDVNNIDPGATETEQAPKTFIDEKFLEDNEQVIRATMDHVYNTENEYSDEQIRSMLKERFVGNLKDRGAVNNTPQDELYDILDYFGTAKVNKNASFYVMNSYVRSIKKDTAAATLENEKSGGGWGTAILVIVIILLVGMYIIEMLLSKNGIEIGYGKKKHQKNLDEKKIHRQNFKSEERDLLREQYDALLRKYEALQKENDSLTSHGTDDVEELKAQKRDLDEECYSLTREKESLLYENEQLKQTNRALSERIEAMQNGKGGKQESIAQKVALRKSLIIEGGCIKIIDGDYVEILCEGNNVVAVPTERALKVSVQRSLSNFFDFSGDGKSDIQVEEPCILEKDSQGYYNIINKGSVRLI